MTPRIPLIWISKRLQTLKFKAYRYINWIHKSIRMPRRKSIVLIKALSYSAIISAFAVLFFYRYQRKSNENAPLCQCMTCFPWHISPIVLICLKWPIFLEGWLDRWSCDTLWRHMAIPADCLFKQISRKFPNRY